MDEGMSLVGEAGACTFTMWGCAATGERVELQCACPERACTCTAGDVVQRYTAAPRFCARVASPSLANGCNVRGLPQELCGLRLWK
jgi:hypothetical protein